MADLWEKMWAEQMVVLWVVLSVTLKVVRWAALMAWPKVDRSVLPWAGLKVAKWAA
tara:strand:+ start:794 stop:961 length:168 start_codon:yes stop_codon:yes gene_type:complete